MDKPKYYSQYDTKWANIPYTIDGDKQETISYSGCGPTCMAMILATWVDPKITPVETCKMAIDMKDRTANDGTEWEFFGHMATKYTLGFKQTSSTFEALTALKTGSLVVCSMGPSTFTKSGHFILIYGVDANGKIMVNDPASTTRSGKVYDSSIFAKECKQYFIFTKPKEMTFEEAIDIISPAAKVDAVYWKKKKTIDPYFEGFVIKIAKYLKGVK